MTRNEFYFSSADETTRVYAVEWLPKGEPKAVLHIFHGDAEQMLRYEELAEYFTGQGFVVVGNEHFTKKTKNFGQEEMHTCLKITKQKYPDIPYLLLGLSTGASMVNSFVKSHPEVVEGVVLADIGQEVQPIDKKLPVLHVSGIEKNCQEVFRFIYRWTEERLDEMLYRAATKQ